MIYFYFFYTIICMFRKSDKITNYPLSNNNVKSSNKSTNKVVPINYNVPNVKSPKNKKINDKIKHKKI